MYIPEKLLIDVEKTNNLSGYFIRSEDGKEIKMIASGKMIIPVDGNEYKNKIYKLLEDNCDLIFCTTDKLRNFEFYPVPMLAIFAADSNGTYFGTIGGMGALGSDDDYPVGYINKEGKHGKIAGSFKEFLELLIFYPYWRDIVEYEQMQLPYNISDIVKNQRKKHSQFFEYQHEISEQLKLVQNPKSIKLLITNLKNPSDFMVYRSKDEAKKENVFLEDINFDGFGKIM
ncbi:hypothetical protein K9O30_03330 [Clostridium bowmanii]|uniref:hypothetical protein n=1 Tax=Clostridium bowmanii TaxID=132925 RepID=UPI001C0C40A9|nr:hypothetical protein [Clostridium bowmanii]MBU3188392.1 hypothetical protein [Clostridium bowmanii]MCA1072780.1 hypothetical protein [Clostridium bowmanii]